MTESAPYSLLAELDKVKDKGRPPIHLWNPENVKDIDMTIEADGSWTYLGTPILRQRLVHLFSTVLRREADGQFYLVTPVEKCRITVKDAPFMAILLDVEGEDEDQRLTFTTNMAEEVTASADHPIRLETDARTGEPSPYVMVRDQLDARLSRPVYYQMADLIVERDSSLGVWSGGTFFVLGSS